MQCTWWWLLPDPGGKTPAVPVRDVRMLFYSVASVRARRKSHVFRYVSVLTCVSLAFSYCFPGRGRVDRLYWGCEWQCTSDRWCVGRGISFDFTWTMIPIVCAYAYVCVCVCVCILLHPCCEHCVQYAARERTPAQPENPHSGRWASREWDM